MKSFTPQRRLGSNLPGPSKTPLHSPSKISPPPVRSARRRAVNWCLLLRMSCMRDRVTDLASLMHNTCSMLLATYHTIGRLPDHVDGLRTAGLVHALSPSPPDPHSQTQKLEQKGKKIQKNEVRGKGRGKAVEWFSFRAFASY